MNLFLHIMFFVGQVFILFIGVLVGGMSAGASPVLCLIVTGGSYSVSVPTMIVFNLVAGWIPDVEFRKMFVAIVFFFEFFLGAFLGSKIFSSWRKKSSKVCTG